jgi:hypothetical protein
MNRLQGNKLFKKIKNIKGTTNYSGWEQIVMMRDNNKLNVFLKITLFGVVIDVLLFAIYILLPVNEHLFWYAGF